MRNFLKGNFVLGNTRESMKAATISPGVYNRRFPVGAEPATDGVYFRVWAPQAKRVELLIGAADSLQPEELEPEAQGYFSGFAPGCAGRRSLPFSPRWTRAIAAGSSVPISARGSVWPVDDRRCVSI